MSRINAKSMLDSYVECLDAARDIALAMGDPASANIDKMRVDALSKTADQYLGALKLIWPKLPEADSLALAKQADAIAKAAFEAETPQSP